MQYNVDEHEMWPWHTVANEAWGDDLGEVMAKWRQTTHEEQGQVCVCVCE
jgi:hypothetical protein